MKPKPFSISLYLPVLLLLFFLSFFAHLGSTPLFDADEGVYSEVTREMTANLNFTSIRLNGEPFFHKPPLFYWAQAASIRILGLSEFGLRLPSAAAALLWAASIFLFTRRSYDTGTAWHAALFMSGSLLVSLVGRAATPDALFSLFLTLTLLNVYRFCHTGDKRHIYWSFMFAGLGVLTKGFFALILPLAVSLVFLGRKKRWRDLLLLSGNPVGLMVFGLIVLPWPLGEFMLHGKVHLGDLLMLPTSPVGSYNFIGGSLPYYSYPLFIIIGLLPFSGMFIKTISQLRQLLVDDLVQFLLVWFLLAFLLLPIVQPDSLLSLSYCFSPLFIIMARTVHFFRHDMSLFIWPLSSVALLLLAPSAAPYLAGSIGDESVRNFITASAAYLDPSYLMSMAAVILLFTGLPFITPVPSPVKYGILGLVFVSLINFLIMPMAGSILQQPVKTAALLAKRENLAVITWKTDHPSFNVYAEMLTGTGAPQTGDILFTKTAYLEKSARYKTLFARHGIILAEVIDFSAAESGDAGN